jgi:predicted RND superfamily exporter protein
MILMDSKMNQTEIGKMVERIKDTDGVSQVVGLDSLVGPAVPVSMLPNGAVSKVKNEDYQIEIILSDYEVASDEMTCQVNEINAILDDYSEKSVLVGEAPLTLDLIKITDHDFKVVNFTSIIAVFLIIFIVFRSVSLPFILVAVIEFAIFINMGIPFYTNSTLPFVASIVIGTIQLGSTVDYAILMTSRYQKERHSGKDKKEALLVAHKASSVSIIMSASGFFAATFGVAVYSSIDMISSLCFLMARGSLISMVVVITILPAFLYLFDPLIAHTTMGFLSDEEKKQK